MYPLIKLPIRYCVLCFAVLCASQAAGAALESGRETGIGRMLREEGLVGASWMTLTPDRGISIAGAGSRHSGTRAVVEPDDRFQVGSIAKVLVATGVLRLVTQGRLALETPVTDVLPELRFINPWQASAPVRVRHLLDHTAGLEDARLWQVFSAEATPDTPLAYPFTRTPSLLRVRTRPGSEFSYSNNGYALLGMLIERITGQRYETYLDEQLLASLGMRDSTFRYVSQSGLYRDPRLVMGHLDRAVPQQTLPMFLRASGQLTTTARDMAVLARFLMSDGTIDGVAFIEERLLRAMGRPVGTLAAAAGLQAGYALGLGRRDRHGAIGLCHGGNTTGFRAMFCLYPDERKAFFIAFNMDSETADYERFNAFLIEALDLHSAQSPPAHSRGVGGDAQRWVGTYVRLPSRVGTFEYLDRLFSFVRLTRSERRLTLIPFLSGEIALNPVDGRRFRAAGRVSASHALLVDDNGRYMLSDGIGTYRQVSGLGIVALWISLAAGALAMLYVLLAGAYRAVTQRLRFLSSPLAAPFAVLMILPASALFFLGQSWVRLGDTTMASVLLASATLMLPFAALYGLCRGIAAGREWRSHKREILALVCVLQWLVVLACWRLVPLRLWA